MAKREHEARERIVRHGHTGSGIVQWTMLLLPVFAAFGEQQLGYGLVVWACTKEMHFLLHLPAIAALVLIVIAATHAWRTVTIVGLRMVADERSSDARARFMAVTTLVFASFATLLVIALWMPVAFIHPCRR